MFSDFDESMVILSDVPSNNPFFKFASFLILSVQMKSVQSFDKLGVVYDDFLQQDKVYQKIYKTYGVFYFHK